MQQIDYTVSDTTKCTINNHLLLTSLLLVSTCTGSSSGRNIQWHTSTENSAKDVCQCVKSQNKILWIKITKNVQNTNQLNISIASNNILSSTTYKSLCQFFAIFNQREYPEKSMKIEFISLHTAMAKLQRLCCTKRLYTPCCLVRLDMNTNQAPPPASFLHGRQERPETLLSLVPDLTWPDLTWPDPALNSSADVNDVGVPLATLILGALYGYQYQNGDHIRRSVCDRVSVTTPFVGVSRN